MPSRKRSVFTAFTSRIHVVVHPGDNPGANTWFRQSTPIQMLPPGGSFCGTLTSNFILVCLQGGFQPQCPRCRLEKTTNSRSVDSGPIVQRFPLPVPGVGYTRFSRRGLNLSGFREWISQVDSGVNSQVMTGYLFGMHFLTILFTYLVYALAAFLMFNGARYW